MNSVCCDETQIESEVPDERAQYVNSLWIKLEESKFCPLNPEQLAAVGEALSDAFMAISSVTLMLWQKRCLASINNTLMTDLDGAMIDMEDTIKWELKAREELRASDPAGYHDLYSRYNLDYLG